MIWERGKKPGPFAVAELDVPREFRWSADGERLWSSGYDWIEWNPLTGERLRRAWTPDNLRMPILPAEKSVPIEFDGDYVGRRKKTREIVALSRDGRRAVLRNYPHSSTCTLWDVENARQIDPLNQLAMPFAFSDDGKRLVAPQLGWRELVLLDPEDARVLGRVPFPLSSKTKHALWAPGGELILDDWSKLVCFHVDYQRPLWEVKGRFRRYQVQGATLVAVDLDERVHVLDLATGEEKNVLERAGRDGLVVAGEPDTAALVERLRKHPIVFSYPAAVTRLRPFAGGEKLAVYSRHKDPVAIRVSDGSELPERAFPWDPPPPEAMTRAIAQKSGVDAYSLGAVSSDGAFCFFLLGRNEDVQPDPDAGRVISYDVSAAMWDVRGERWLWETAQNPDRFLLAYLFNQGQFSFSADDSGIFAEAGSYGRAGTLYDTATGKPRGSTAADLGPPAPELPDLPGLAPDEPAVAVEIGKLLIIGTKMGRLLSYGANSGVST